MSDIKLGDRVQLKSGGPIMVVEAIQGTIAVCVWTPKVLPKRGRFELQTLRIYETPQAIIPITG